MPEKDPLEKQQFAAGKTDLAIVASRHEAMIKLKASMSAGGGERPPKNKDRFYDKKLKKWVKKAGDVPATAPKVEQ